MIFLYKMQSYEQIIYIDWVYEYKFIKDLPKIVDLLNEYWIEIT